MGRNIYRKAVLGTGEFEVGYEGEFSSDSWYVVNNTAKTVSIVSIMIASALRAQSST